MAPHAFKKRRLNSLSPSDWSSDEFVENDRLAGSDVSSESPTANPQVVKQNRLKNRENKKESSGLSLPPWNGTSSSSVLKVQTDELLATLRREHEKGARSIENTLRNLKAAIERIGNHGPETVLDAERRLHADTGTRIPFPARKPWRETRCLLSYAKPIDVTVVGSYARKAAVRTGDLLPIDMAVTMPSAIFQNKDFLNFRYFQKRAYYVACLASGLKSDQEIGCSINYAYQNDNPLQPIILVEPSSEHPVCKPKFQIRIIIAASSDLFPVSKTLPTRNCIQPQRLVIDGGTAESAAPTPFYNATLRSECCSLPFLKLLHAARTYTETFRDGCMLGSVWLRQRGMGKGLRTGGFGPFEWAYLLAILLQGGGMNKKPILSKGYSGLQLFRATLEFLSARDLASDPLLVKAKNGAVGNSSGPVILDGPCGINILFKMTTASYNRLRHEARTTGQAMTAPLVNRFGSTFVARHDDALQRYDLLLRLPLPHKWQSSDSVNVTDQSHVFCCELYDVLNKGLRERVDLVYPYVPKPHSPWSTSEDTPRDQNDKYVLVGLLTRSDQAFRTVDHGPSPDDKEAAATFRQFWGEKSELRRFRDGSMSETLIWARKPERSVLQQIIRYIILRHFGQEVLERLEIYDDTFRDFITEPGPLNPARPIMSAFETLEKDIRHLEDLPLRIRKVSAIGAELRYTATAQGPSTLSREGRQIDRPADVCVQFEGSARWPNDIVAVQRTKIAFLLKIGELLQEHTDILAARLGLENESRKLLNHAFLDVVYPGQAAFRLRIHHDLERDMLRRALKDRTAGVAPHDEIAFAIAAYQKSFVQAELHAQAVRTLCSRHLLLSSSIRLLKRWRDSHLLSGHISDELIELLIIRTFVTPFPYQAPGSLATAFFRTLAFVSQWDWHNEPLIVDINGSMTVQEIDSIKLRFKAWRKIDPAMNRVVLFAASNHDLEGITWTEYLPSKVVASRFTQLAKASCNIIKDQGLDIQPNILFTPSTVEYDFVVHLDSPFRGGFSGIDKKKAAFKNLQLQDVEDVSLTAYHPLKSFVEELKDLYGSDILFFFDESAGSIIAGLWNPHTGLRSWKVNVPYSSLPTTEAGEERIAINKTATLHDIAMLGSDLVRNIESR